ncbi:MULTISPECIES: carbohydrate ABC transporter permease [unclassified Oceanispirochaeta]|uniref:carbohydrate ABC transporter permease n=1 Tax=unclassified Oceanispirochaeta TaxID=2635722 RepID=UPI000E09CC62|nr:MULTISPECIES: carbohydrate ABC transporter permease [unclassified Oceanispirochaeta]MBF9017730.1 carbohydrate ABC transporter permease [Oceanispirochaeta sp. M2]NPD72133.1 carbohydrate ABC transporter permease [Oceanispirochaeta sp. M1]RDG32575.1 carbohydrate ABC transporter permease [Oceanispirochaeta sp. M1]
MKLFNKNTIKKIPSYGILSLWVLFTAVLIGWIMIASLSTTREIFTNTLLKSGVHFSNYTKALINHNVGQYFLNSLLYTFSAGFSILIISAPCAYVLARFEFKGNKLIQNLFVGSLGVPIIMIILPLFALASQLRMTNSRILLIILYICITTPFTVFFLLSFFKTLSTSFEEAAAIDGCSPIRTFWTIMFPLAQPGLITVGIFNFIALWNEYFIALVFANTSEQRPLAVGLMTMIQSMRYTGDWAGMFAAVVIVFVPTFLLYIFLSEKIIAGVTGGAIKG